MKRKTTQPSKLRDRRSGQSPWQRHGKTETKYFGMTANRAKRIAAGETIQTGKHTHRAIIL